MGEQVLSVVTDSARDLLQSAEFFSNEKLVAWEYISNGLQYVDPARRRMSTSLSIPSRSEWLSATTGAG